MASVTTTPPAAGASWRHVWRRRLAPIAIVGALVLLGRDMCAKREHQPTTVEIVAPYATRSVTRVRGVLRAGDTEAATVERASGDAAFPAIKVTAQFGAAGARGGATAELEVFTPGKLISVTRRFSAPAGGSVKIDISDALQ